MLAVHAVSYKLLVIAISNVIVSCNDSEINNEITSLYRDLGVIYVRLSYD